MNNRIEYIADDEDMEWCPFCKGEQGNDCTYCHGHGVVTSAIFERVPIDKGAGHYYIANDKDGEG